MTTLLERIWITYALCVVTIALLAEGGGEPGHAPGLFVVIHVGVAAANTACALVVPHWQPGSVRVLRSVLAVIGCPVVFSSLAMLLPAVHPEPFELSWLALDRMVFGTDATLLLFPLLPAWSFLLLQSVYMLFYLLPIAAVLAGGRRYGGAAFDRALVIMVGSFLISYLGYLLVPTLSPKAVYPPSGVLEFGGMTAFLHESIDVAELNRWDCFPSGHTMLSCTSVLVVFRWARSLTPWFLLVAMPLITSTMALRYHWPIDVVAGAALAWPVARLCDYCCDRDGMPPVGRR